MQQNRYLQNIQPGSQVAPGQVVAEYGVQPLHALGVPHDGVAR